MLDVNLESILIMFVQILLILRINENFNSPHQISLSENHIYVLDTYNYQVKIFSNQNLLEFNEDMSETNDFSLPIIIILSIIIIIVVYTIFLRNKLV